MTPCPGVRNHPVVLARGKPAAEGPVPHPEVHVDDIGVLGDRAHVAGVDVHGVQASVRPHGVRHEFLDRGVDGDVEPGRDRLATGVTEGRGGPPGPVEVEVPDDDSRALLRRPPRRRGAQPGGRTGDQDDLVLQSLHAVPFASSTFQPHRT
jgi:hypothetical protein